MPSHVSEGQAAQGGGRFVSEEDCSLGEGQLSVGGRDRIGPGVGVGREGAGSLASPCPLPLAALSVPRPQPRSLNGPGSEQGVCQC